MRDRTNQLIQMMDEGIINPRTVADMALGAMSEDDVADMMRANDLLDEQSIDGYNDDLLAEDEL